MKKQVKVYLHSSKEDNWFTFSEALGIDAEDYDNEILKKLQYALYEVEFTLEVDTETGEYEIIKVKE